MKVSDVNACALPEWYGKFAKVTFPSEIVPIPPTVLSYLNSRGSVVLPLECDQDLESKHEIDEDDIRGDETEFTGHDDATECEEERPSFPEFSASVRKAIKSMGGSVFCKLNWSAPRDASWITFGNTLRCSNLSDLYLLLKSSTFIQHDLTQPFKDCDDKNNETAVDKYYLILRQWADINPSHEFRCFVKNKILRGITQRDGTQFYKYIANEEENILRDIKTFFDEQIKDRFPLDDCVFDVVRSAKDDVMLVDFNAYGVTTDPIFFTWDELFNLEPDNENKIDFRFAKDDAGIQPNGLQQYSLPRDVVDLSSGTDPDKLIDFLKLQKEAEETRQ